MANSPNPDRSEALMQEDFGTKVLITDIAADKLLARVSKNNPSQKKFTEFCGGAGGWSDFTERWH